MANESTKWLYDQLKGKGYNVGKDVAEFDNLMQTNAESRKWAYETATKSGLNVGKDIDEFSSLVGGKTETSTSAGAVSAASPEDKPAGAGEATQKPWRPTPMQKTMMMNEIQSGVDASVGSMQRGMENARRVGRSMTQAGRDERKGAETLARMAGTPTKVLGLTSGGGTESGGEGKASLNPTSPTPHGVKVENGEAKTEWLLPDGSLTTDLVEADKAEYNARKARLQHEFVRRMEKNGLDPAKQEDVEKQRQTDLLDTAEKRTAMRLRENEENLHDLYAERGRELDEESGWNDDEGFWSNFVRIVGGAANRSATANAPKPKESQTAEDKARGTYLAENQILTDARKLLETRKLSKSEGFMGGFWNVGNNWRNMKMGAKHAAQDPDLYAGGVVALQKASQLMGIEDKLKQGEDLSDAEVSLVYSTMLGQDVAHNVDTPHGYTAAQITVEMFPFMVQMALNPASGLSRALVTKYGKSGLRKIAARKAAEGLTGEAAEAFAKKEMRKLAAKTTGVQILGDLAESAVLANTLQAPKTTANAMERYQGEVREDPEGNVTFDGSHNWGEAIYKAQASEIIENYTEKLGSHLGIIGNAASKAAKKGLQAIGGGKVLDAVSSMIEKVGSTEWAKAIGAVEKRAQWNGTVGEVLEEEAGIVLNSIFTGDNKISDLWDADQQIDIVLGVGLFGGFVSGLKTAGYPIARAKAKSDLRQADVLGGYRFGSESSDGGDWASIKREIDNADEKDLAETVRNLVQAHAKSEEQMRTIVNYAKSLMKARGLEISTESRRSEGGVTPEEQDIEESFDHGVEIGGGGDAQAMSDAKRLMERERGRLASSLSEDEVAAYDEDPIGALSRTEDPELRSIAADYVNAKAAYDGMIERVRDDIDERVAQSDAVIEGRRNKETGKVQLAEYGADRKPVYIVSGTVTMYEDGTGVDPEKSSESVIIRELDGKVRFVDPREIKGVGEAVDAEEVKASERQRIMQEMAQAAADRIDGVLSFAAGETYSVLDKDGNPDEVTVLGNSVDEEGMPVDWSVDLQHADGRIESVATADLQEWADAANAQRVETFAEERDAERAAGVTSSTEEEAPTGISPEDGPADAGGVVVGDMGAALPEDSAEETALGRIAKDEAGNPLYESATPDLAWDALVEQAEGDEDMALEIAEEQRADRESTWDAAKGVVAEIEEELEAAKNEKPELPEGYKAMSISDQIKARKEAKAQTSERVRGIEARLAEALEAADYAEAGVVFWEEIGKTKQLREEAAAKAEAERLEAERKAELERRDAEARVEAERLRREREERDGMPDMADDTPAEARARGARKAAGTVYRRQEPITEKIEGKEVTVDFNEKKEGHRPKGRLVVMEAAQGQASHMEGKQNPLFFIDEAQPKDRTDAESVIAEQRHAREMDPALITDSRDMVDPFRGAPTVNARGETIQGNHRMATLRYMYANEPESQKRYRDYLSEHAEEFGFTPEQVRAIDYMEEPILVNMLDVDDDMAIELGLDTGNSRETGGKDRIDTDRLATSIGDKMGRFMDTLLTDDSEEGESLRSLIRRNGLDALKYLRDMGKIDDRQYGTAITRDGSLSDEGLEDLEKFIKRTFFAGESKEFEEMFGTLPAKAQGAVLSQIWRDTRTAKRDRLTPHVKEAVRAFYAMSGIPQFKEARNVKDALRAAEMWRMQTEIGAEGEIVSNRDRHSNLAMHLAAMMKGATMKETRSVLKQMLDWMQTEQTRMADMFADEEQEEDRTLEAAVRKVLGIEYRGGEASPVMTGVNARGAVTNGASEALDKEKEPTNTDSYGENGGADVAGADQGEPQGERGSASDGRGRERAEEGDREAEPGGGAGALRATGTETGNGEGTDGSHLFEYFTGTLADLIRRARSGAAGLIKKIICPVSSRLQNDLRSQGIEISGEYNHVLDNNAIRHTFNQHGSKKKEESRGQVAITEEDFGKIGEIVEEYDDIRVEDGKTGAPRIIYSKSFPDGTTIYVEEQRKGRKELAAVTMWKHKKTALTDAKSENAPQISDLSGDDSTSRESIPEEQRVGAKSSEGAEVSPESRPADAGDASVARISKSSLPAEEALTAEEAAANAAIDAYAEDFAGLYERYEAYAEASDGLADELMERLEGELRLLGAILEDELASYYRSLGNSDADSALMARDKAGLVRAEVTVRMNRRRLSRESARETDMRGRKLSEREATELIARMESTAEAAPALTLTPENWISEFGEDGKVETPIEEVKMGENQYFKMARQGREGKLGMVKPTLQHPDVIVEDYRPATAGVSERDTSYIFIKTFRKEDGSRFYYFTSVTVRKEGREVVISNQERSEKRISTLLRQGKVAWINNGILHPKSQVGKSVSLNDSSSPTKSDNGTARLGVNSSANDEKLSLSSEWSLTETPNETEGPDLVPTTDKVSSEGEGDVFLTDKQAERGKSSEIRSGNYRSAAREAAERLGERLGVEIEVLEDADGLSGRKRTAKGWYDTESGKITVVAGNHRSASDMEATILHEAVGHHGLRELFGTRFDAFLDAVYAQAEDRIKEQIDVLATRNGWNRRVATEEYMAGLAEDGSFMNADKTWWDKVKSLFADLLQSFGFSGNMRLTDNELRYVLWMSWRNLQEPGAFRGILGTAERVAKEYELGVGEFSPLDRPADATAAYDARYNKQLEKWSSGNMKASDHISLGAPTGVMKNFMPQTDIILRQKVLSKARKKHGLTPTEVRNLPSALADPIFVFKREDNAIGVLTSLKSDSGKNIFVAVNIGTEKQLGSTFMEINDIASIHGREVENVVRPITENGTLVWVNKEKGLRWLSSAKSNSQAIATETFDYATKIVEKFKNPKSEGNILYRDGDFTARDRATASAWYELMLSRGSYQAREAMQDSMLGLKKLYEAILTEGEKARRKGFRIEDVAGYENAYTALSFKLK